MSDVIRAVQNGDRDALQAALSAGSDFDAMDDVSGESALAIAAREGSLELVRALLEAGADPNSPLTTAWPLGNAAIEGHCDVVELLLDYDADIDATDECGNSALASAAAAGRLEVVEQLVEAGARPRQKGSQGRRPIVMAAENGHQTVVDYLKQFATSADKKEVAVCLKRHSRGPILEAVVAYHDSAFLGHISSLQEYLRNGGIPDAPDEYGVTAACLAANRNRVDVLRILQEAGADLAHVTDANECPLYYAAMGGHEEAYDYLWDFTPARYQKAAAEKKAERIREGMWHGKS
ncbi:ankyrin repeat domain-containing protein [Lacipirellula limnantheis]|uniref:Ankyrin repeats (3 copies) n=1 Tax=Lacipirellula limnantheis TaxID=2528024 RepID=A0A517U1J5_9BACT|nr:ankyrin repeat domain-containing protein [Lacipirellula limnantheis]QDT74509.1 Ankyrin repeats (3 copies) [Lacipirellula limnantheis]